MERVRGNKPPLEIEFEVSSVENGQNIREEFLADEEFPLADATADFLLDLVNIDQVEGLILVREKPALGTPPLTTLVLMPNLSLYSDARKRISSARQLFNKRSKSFQMGLRYGNTSDKPLDVLFDSARELDRIGEAEVLAMVKLNHQPQV